MKLISVWNPKGGSGKSTTAINLAAAAIDIGMKALVVCDDAQGTALAFAEEGNVPFEVSEGNPKNKPDVDLIIFDHSAASYRKPTAPVVITPVLPCRVDFRALKDASSYVEGKIVIKVLVNFDTRIADEKDLSLKLSRAGACMVKNRSVYKRANSRFVTIFDPWCDKIHGARPARAEFRQLLASALQACERKEVA